MSRPGAGIAAKKGTLKALVKSESNTVSGRRKWPLILLTMLWTNLPGGAGIGPAIIEGE